MGLASSMRLPLYAPSIAATLPFVIAEASEGRYTPLVGISSAMWSGGPDRMALGMHMSVICAEDFPRMTTPPATSTSVPALFGDQLANFYNPVCPGWFGGNKPVIPAAFYAVPPVTYPTLVLSGGADPVTPPRHGAYVTKALGPMARHIVAPQVGHIVMFQGCARDMVMKFIDIKEDAQALKLDENCIAKLQKLPRASVYLPPALFSDTQNQRASNHIQTGVQ
jgi:pimeloyl-ACP methyl ester carboxylesterase